MGIPCLPPVPIPTSCFMGAKKEKASRCTLLNRVSTKSYYLFEGFYLENDGGYKKKETGDI
jgi:hypothetical protein